MPASGSSERHSVVHELSTLRFFKTDNLNSHLIELHSTTEKYPRFLTKLSRDAIAKDLPFLSDREASYRRYTFNCH